MHRQPRRASAETRTGGELRVQPDETAGDSVAVGRPVPRGWLPSRGEEAARLDRLLGDAELVGRLQWAGFAGAEYDRFAEELARYGIAVLTSWMFHRTIFERVTQRGFGGLPPLPVSGWDRDTRDELAGDTVVVALRRFRVNVLIPHKWDHAKGATLRTYFIGQCLLCFPNEYRAWHGRQLSWEKNHVAMLEHADQWRSRDHHVDDKIILSAEVRRALVDLPDDRTRTVLILTAVGFKQYEIAQKMNCTQKTIEMIVRRNRQRIDHRGDRDEAS